MERPEAIRRHVMHLRRIQARILLATSPDITDPPPLPPPLAAPAEFQRTCAPPEEDLLMDCCFENGDGEAVGYENVDEPVQLDAGDVNDGGRDVEGILIPSQAWRA